MKTNKLTSPNYLLPINPKLQRFTDTHLQAIAEIEECLKPSQYEPDMSGLVEWLLTTDANPYSYLQYEFAGMFESAEQFVSLLSMISHALYDDGEITFVAVDGEPRIVFANQYEDDFRKNVLTELEQDIESRLVFGRPVSYEIQVLNIKPNDFGKLYDEWYTNDIKHDFFNDAEMFTVDWAIKHYQEYKLFNQSWIEEFNNQPK